MVFIFLFLVLKQCLTTISGKIKGMVLQQVADNMLCNHKFQIFFRIFQYEQKRYSQSDAVKFQFPGLPVLLSLGDSEGYFQNMETEFQYILQARMQDGN